AAAGATVAVALLVADAGQVIAAVVVHAGILGWALGVVGAYQWEVIGKGVSQARRGQALALAFGVGPILAFLSSLASQQVLTGLAYPWNFGALFAATVPLMAVAAVVSTLFVVPPPAVEVKRPPLFTGVFGGFGDFFRDRLILRAALATILVSSGYNVLTNLS